LTRLLEAPPRYQQCSDLIGRIIRVAMDNDAKYDTNLLRVIIGFLHVSLSQQLALMRHGKAFELLTKAEKNVLQSEMINSVMTVARQVGEEELQGFLKPPPPTPSGPVN